MMDSMSGRWWGVRFVAIGLLAVLANTSVVSAQTSGKHKKKASGSVATHRSKTTSHASQAGRGTSRKASAKGARGKNARGRNREVVVSKGHHARMRVEVAPTAESRRLTLAFTASAQLRPMAQQLIATRSAAAYNGVLGYASSHSGEAGAAADLSVGHAYMLDHRYAEAESAFRQAGQRGQSLDDYADYLGAQAAVQGNRASDAYALLDHFAERHPGSLFVPTAPILLANAYLGNNDPASALRVLLPLQSEPAGSHVDFRFTLAKAYQASGNTQQAAALYRGLYTRDPLSNEAAEAKTQLAAMNVPLTAAERKQHADAMFNAKHYDIAQEEYRALQKNDSELSSADRDALEIYAAVCDLRLKKLSRGDVDHLPVTGDDSAALKMYLQSELARNEGRTDEHDRLVQQMLSQYPQSRWLEEALYSGGNMYLLKRDSAHAIAEYTLLGQHFPRSTYAPNAHWRAAWLSYRLRHYGDAARLMDEQITNYPAGTEIPGALYWRGRMYEDVEGNFGQAINYYKTLDASYVNSYYAMLARQRIAVLGNRTTPEPAAALASVRPVNDPELTDSLPENDPHLIKARLLANAALNEYIRPEIQLSETSSQWGALAEAEIYESFGENTRALQAMKRSGLPFFSLPVAEVPMVYWQLVFPRPYWQELSSNAQINGLDPYLVASLIRQESEFNPGAVSKANAYGLMQLLPSVGKSLAKQTGNRHLTTSDLLNPSINLRLGTIDLKKSIDRYSGQIEYALAAYNAGDLPVRQWIATNDYKDIPEWVESIPYTETREYVQGILRNRELYRAVYSGKP
ncbi:Lytic transglycosylase catalytic [Granulicella mallensis MP5ACTX8]|uniref:Lytic transglycosylase catalytic n=1 Tax=Granulicella mallensis (strain ATCC BAA-1857 / DSM 23137 / MP5ACTX8) TaxID=682795 RepID=G8NT49_GRAMM|nr:Lytic transglycosylase catalytic [Granulicella mallensis MP5ACTX8]